MEKCRCSGLNSNCFICGGLGYYEPMPHLIDISKTDRKYEGTTIQNINRIKTILSEIISNAWSYEKETFIKLTEFFENRISKINSNELEHDDKVKKDLKVYNCAIVKIKKIIDLELYAKPKKKKLPLKKKKRKSKSEKNKAKIKRKLLIDKSIPSIFTQWRKSD